jgi:hypothetical protein
VATALDGSQVTLDAPMSLDAPFSAHATIRQDPAPWTCDFFSHPGGWSDGAQGLIDLGDRGSMTFRDGELRWGRHRYVDQVQAERSEVFTAWEGPYSCIFTAMGGVPTDAVVAYFDAINFEDTPTGLAIQSPLERTRPVGLTLQVTEELVLDIQPLSPAIAKQLADVPAVTRPSGGNLRIETLGETRDPADPKSPIPLQAVSLELPTIYLVCAPLVTSKAALDDAVALLEVIDAEWLPS